MKQVAFWSLVTIPFLIFVMVYWIGKIIVWVGESILEAGIILLRFLVETENIIFGKENELKLEKARIKSIREE